MSVDSPNLTMGVFPDEDPLLASVKRAALGKYDILGELGRGGMACVYLAHDITLDRKVAIKVMLPEVLRQKGMTERFKQEAKTAGKLGHPHIVPIYAVHDTENSVFFVMKYVDGRALDRVIKEHGPLPFDMARTVINQVATGLDFAHRHGVIHRDVKPANVMLDNEGFAVVTDFGVAKITLDAGLTHSGSIVGTPYYMSPEQGVGEKVTPASDQYSLGVVAFEMLTGVRPFEDQSYGALVVAHQSRPVPPIADLRPDCPPQMRAAVERMMAKKPAERFPSLRDAATAFSSTAPVEPLPQPKVQARPVEPLPAAPAALPPVPPVLPKAAPKAAAPSGRRRWAKPAGVLAVGILAFTGYQVFKPPPKPVPVPEPVPVDTMVTLQSSDAWIQIGTTPGGAVPMTLFIDGTRSAGILGDPVVQAIKPQAPTRVRIAAVGCTAYDTVVSVRAGDTLRLGRRAATCPSEAAAILPQRPKAYVQIGVDRSSPLWEGVTMVIRERPYALLDPAYYEVPAGVPTEIALHRRGCSSWGTTVTVQAGDTARLGLKGVTYCQNGAWIHIGAKEGMTVPVDLYVGGMLKRSGIRDPEFYSFPPGFPTQVRVSAAGCTPWDTMVTVKYGDTLPLSRRAPTCGLPVAPLGPTRATTADGGTRTRQPLSAMSYFTIAPKSDFRMPMVLYISGIKAADPLTRERSFGVRYGYPVRIELRASGCTSFDTTITLPAETQLPLGQRAPKCP